MKEDLEDQMEENFEWDPSRDLKPRIFEGDWCKQELLREHFDAVTIQLDGRIKSTLDWKEAREQAQKAIDQGYAILWDLQLGLFKELLQPLVNQTQFLSLTLSLEHFRDSIWKEFKSHTIGLSIFRGNADFNQEFVWNQDQEQNLKGWLKDRSCMDLAALDRSSLMHHPVGQQLVRLFCRDVLIEYLALLVNRIPDHLPVYLYLDVASIAHSPIDQLQILNPERFDRLHLILKGSSLPFNAWGWEQPTPLGYVGQTIRNLPSDTPHSIGLCIPPFNFYHSHHYQGLKEGIAALQQQSLPFKLIAENQLTIQWDGLDYLLYTSAGLSGQGKRKLQGFCAAGGTVIATHDLLGLSQEMSLVDWLSIIS